MGVFVSMRLGVAALRVVDVYVCGDGVWMRVCASCSRGRRQVPKDGEGRLGCLGSVCAHNYN